MFDKAIQFLKDHKEIALATCEGNLPKLRIFQIMKQEGHWPTQIIFPLDAQEW